MWSTGGTASGAPALRPVAAVADVVAGAGIVGPLLGIDPEERLVGHDREADVVEHEELGLWRDQRAVGDAARARRCASARSASERGQRS